MKPQLALARSPRLLESQSGLTLVELVVSLAVTGLALAAGYGAFATIVDLRDSADQASEEVVRAGAIRHDLREWLAAARLTTDPGGPSFRGLDGIHEDRPDDALVFLSSAMTPLESRETVVRLFVDRSEETVEEGLVAELIEWRGPGRTTIEVESRVRALETRYLSTVTGDRRWLPSWISSSVLPRAVELRLTAAAGDSLPALLALPMLVPLAGGR